MKGAGREGEKWSERKWERAKKELPGQGWRLAYHMF